MAANLIFENKDLWLKFLNELESILQKTLIKDFMKMSSEKLEKLIEEEIKNKPRSEKEKNMFKKVWDNFKK